MNATPHRISVSLRRFRAALLPFLFVLPCIAAQTTAGRVIVLGFDGVDAALTERWMEEGKLPHLARLRREGTFTPLGTTNPPQTPVSWSSFSTGLNPGRTEIFDFLKRVDGSYYPTFALNEEGKRPFGLGERNAAAAGCATAAAVLGIGAVAARRRRRRWIAWSVAVTLAAVAGAGTAWATGRWIPREVPQAVNNRKGQTLWEAAARHGIAARVIRVPATFPAETVAGGEMLSGLGVPDMRGRIGTPVMYVSSPAYEVRDNEFSIETVRLPSSQGRIETALIGPYNKPFFDYAVERAAAGAPAGEERRRASERESERLRREGVPKRLDVPLTLDISPQRDRITLLASGSSATLGAGEWSDWFVVKFPVNWLADRLAPLQGMVRFKAIALEPELQIYQSPVNFHPDCHPIPFSYPVGYASRLARAVGLYKTIGWDIDTWTPAAGVTDEEFLLQDVEYTVERERALMEHELGRGDFRLYIQVFYFPDRVSHILWRLFDEGHPLYDAARARRYGGAILESYQRMDSLVGRARELLKPQDVLLVLSDHGFSSWRRGINYNAWLHQNGFMTLRQPAGGIKSLEDLFDRSTFFEHVDWSRTQAYSIGLGAIYVNLMGREPNGSVEPGEPYEKVRSGIIQGLESYVDAATGLKPVRKVYRREEMYSGFDPRLIPDLRAANERNYRVGWQTALGQVPRDVMEENRRLWSADHCSVDPELVPGILFSSRRLEAERGASIVDIYPTVLELLGVPAPEGLDGRSLL